MARTTFEETLADFWRGYAASYDRILPLIPFYQTAVQRHIVAILNSGARRVLDIGCGTGNVAVPLAVAGLDITGIDNSAAMLERMRQKTAAFDVTSRIEIREVNAESTTITEKYDAANILLALFCMGEGEDVLQRVVQSLRVGGIVVLTEPTKTFQEQPLLDYGYDVIFGQLKRNELENDWEVVRDAGKRLGALIRDFGGPEMQPTHKIRSDDIVRMLKQQNCTILRHCESHLGQCRHIIACRTS